MPVYANVYPPVSISQGDTAIVVNNENPQPSLPYKSSQVALVGGVWINAQICTNNKVGATEVYARGISWGLMQVMGQTAREMGMNSPFLSAICDPAVGLAVGCKVLRKKMDACGGDIHRGLLAWNGGSNPDYADEVLAREARYQ